jgi:hypothetical protein
MPNSDTIDYKVITTCPHCNGELILTRDDIYVLVLCDCDTEFDNMYDTTHEVSLDYNCTKCGENISIIIKED